MLLESLPADLPVLPAPVLSGDPDGVIERAAFALLFSDVVASARLALTIANPYRRAAWLRGFRPATLQAAREGEATHGPPPGRCTVAERSARRAAV